MYDYHLIIYDNIVIMIQWYDYVCLVSYINNILYDDNVL